jgi:hypothetical protein
VKNLTIMTRSLYAFTADSPHKIYTCHTYRPSLSHKYGICKSLHDPGTLDLTSVSLGPVSVGNIILVIFLLACIVGLVVVLLRLLEWAMEEGLMARLWALCRGASEGSWRRVRRAERRRWKL